MSYAFGARGPSKTDAILDADAKIDKLCSDMPIHEKDRTAIQDHVRKVVGSIADPEYNEEIQLTIHGYLAWTNDSMSSQRITSCFSAVTASLVLKSKAK